MIACTDTLSIKLPLSYSSRPSRVRLPEPPKALKLRYVSWKCTNSLRSHALRGKPLDKCIHSNAFVTTSPLCLANPRCHSAADTGEEEAAGEEALWALFSTSGMLGSNILHLGTRHRSMVPCRSKAKWSNGRSSSCVCVEPAGLIANYIATPLPLTLPNAGVPAPRQR